MKNEHIDKLIGATNNFVVETLCPMVEEFSGNKSGVALNSALYATLRTVARNIDIGNLKVAKSGGKFVVLDNDETKEEGDESGITDDVAEEIFSHVEQIIKIAKKNAKNGEDFFSNLASAALSIVQTGGSGAMLALLIGLDGIFSDKI